MCLEILTQGRSPLLSVKISLFDVCKKLLTLHKLTPTSDATSLRKAYPVVISRPLIDKMTEVILVSLIHDLTKCCLKEVLSKNCTQCVTGIICV